MPACYLNDPITDRRLCWAYVIGSAAFGTNQRNCTNSAMTTDLSALFEEARAYTGRHNT